MRKNYYIYIVDEFLAVVMVVKGQKVKICCFPDVIEVANK